MKYASNRVLVMMVGAGLLWGGMALAKNPNVEQRERSRDSCKSDCRLDEKTCTTVCKKHAGAAGGKCTEICKQATVECEQECDEKGKK